MFNLPFPTDSLYKFAFMFGLVLIVFSFYFRDKQLNRFDTKGSYYILDSLDKNLSDAVLIRNADSLQTALTTDSIIKMSDEKLIDFVRSWDFVKTDFSDNSTVTSAFAAVLADSIKKDEKLHYKFYYLRSLIMIYTNNDVIGYQKKIDFNKSKLFLNSLYFYSLLIIGLTLFILGTIGWYFKIQVPQDKLLQMQLAEAQKHLSLREESTTSSQ